MARTPADPVAKAKEEYEIAERRVERASRKHAAAEDALDAAITEYNFAVKLADHASQHPLLVDLADDEEPAPVGPEADLDHEENEKRAAAADAAGLVHGAEAPELVQSTIEEQIAETPEVERELAEEEFAQANALVEAEASGEPEVSEPDEIVEAPAEEPEPEAPPAPPKKRAERKAQLAGTDDDPFKDLDFMTINLD